MKKIAVFAVLALSGCVTATPIQPIGNGLFSVTADSHALGATIGSTRTNALSQANAYCSTKGLAMAVDHAEDLSGINSASTTVTFRCE